MMDLDADLVELTPWVPPASPLREIDYRSTAWLPSEIDMLREMFLADRPIEEIAGAVGRTFQATRTRIWELGLRRNSSLPWSEIEDAELARRYRDEPAARIAGEFGRSPAAIYARGSALGLSEPINPDYEPWEDAQIAAGYAAAIPCRQLAALLGRPVSGLMTRASTLRLRHPSLPPDWSDEEARRAMELAETGLLYSKIRRQLVQEGFPPRSKQGFGQKLRILGYGRGWGRPWMPDEDEIVKRAYRNSESLTPLVAQLGRTRTAICWRSRALGVAGTHKSKAGFRQGPDWSAEHNARLREAYGKVPMEELAAELGRTVRQVYMHAWQLKISAGYNRRFTPEDDAAIRQAVTAGDDLRTLAKPLDRQIDAIQRRAKRLGLTKRAVA